MDATAAPPSRAGEAAAPAPEAGRGGSGGSSPPLRDSAAPEAGAAADPVDPEADAGCESEADGDCCPDDSSKTAPGACGCGVADGDGDGDAVPDCLDACPSDPAKTAAGLCGCGLPDSDADGVASCVGLRSALVHRYRFDGAGTTAADTKGSAHGTIHGTELADTGALTLAGVTSDQYVDLPNGLVSGLADATVEVWATWAGGAPWQRIFDFGDSTSTTEGVQAEGRTELFITPYAAGDGTNLLALFKTPAGDVIAESAAPMPIDVMQHLAVVIDDDDDRMTLYVDGQLAASALLTASLSEINDINNWIGRSQWLPDDELAGVVYELRIYAAALSAAQLATSFSAGPDPAFLDP